MKDELSEADHEHFQNDYADRQSWLYTMLLAYERFGEEKTLKYYNLKELPDFDEFDRTYTWPEFLELLRTEVVYVQYDWEQCVIKSVPNGPDSREFFIKFKGKDARKAEHGSKIVADALLEMKIITQRDYDKY